MVSSIDSSMCRYIFDTYFHPAIRGTLDFHVPSLSLGGWRRDKPLRRFWVAHPLGLVHQRVRVKRLFHKPDRQALEQLRDHVLQAVTSKTAIRIVPAPRYGPDGLGTPSKSPPRKSGVFDAGWG